MLLKTKTPSLERHFVVRDERDHRRAVSLMREVLRAIDVEIYYPNPGWYCPECPFKGACDRDL